MRRDDGSLDELHFVLRDNSYKEERIDYGYDTRRERDRSRRADR